MSTWEEDQDRLRVAWTRFYVVAVYRPLRPIVARMNDWAKKAGL